MRSGSSIVLLPYHPRIDVFSLLVPFPINKIGILILLHQTIQRPHPGPPLAGLRPRRGGERIIPPLQGEGRSRGARSGWGLLSVRQQRSPTRLASLATLPTRGRDFRGSSVPLVGRVPPSGGWVGRRRAGAQPRYSAQLIGVSKIFTDSSCGRSGLTR